MAKQMATKQGVRVSGKDSCAWCGEPLTTNSLIGLLRPGSFETGWDGQKWVPYHPICWQQVQYRKRARAGL